MASDATGLRRDRGSVSSGADSMWRYLVLASAAELPIALLALASTTALGPNHAVTTAFALFLMFATPFVGVASFAGLVFDGRRSHRSERGVRWRWYAGTALLIAAFLAYHGTVDDAFFGRWEPAVALALAMVPVGVTYWVRGWSRRSREVASG